MGTFDPAKVRNVGIAGHSGTGKTTLIEHLLRDAGLTSRLGTVEEGNTVCDYLEEEIAQKHTVAMKLCHLDWHGARIHFVDLPGSPDFVGEMASVAPLLDGLLILVDAASGIQAGTDLAWKYAEQYKIPRAFFVNKLDREHTDFHAVVDALRETYGKQCVPLVVPLGTCGSALPGVVNIFDGDTHAVMDKVASIKEEMADAVAETNDQLLEKYLATGELSPDEFHRGLHDGITAARIMPVIAGSTVRNFGVDELLDVVADSFPTPLDRHIMVTASDGSTKELPVDPDGPLLAQVFRSVVDPYVGHLTLVRVLSGTLRADMEFQNVTSGHRERAGRVLLLNGKNQQPVEAVGPGDLAAMAKLKHTHFGNVLTTPGADLNLPPIALPPSMVRLAIAPKTHADDDKLGDALHRLAEEDPTFQHYRDPETGDLVVRGVGDQQLEILLDRMKRRYKVEVTTSTPKVAYRETIKGRAEAQGKHKKQSGGHGQFADVHIRLSPSPRGEGYQFVDGIVGGVVPRQYIPAVDKGAQECLARGIISGHPAVDVTVELYDGTYHSVDSSEMAFKIAASLGIRKAFREARPCILEPIMEITVIVPEECMGDITGDFTGRRGRILGVDTAGPGRQVVRAQVPESEILRYSSTLRGKTGGRGSFELTFSHYDEAPETVTKGLIAEYEKGRTEED